MIEGFYQIIPKIPNFSNCVIVYLLLSYSL
jgi:hypothetical protein